MLLLLNSTGGGARPERLISENFKFKEILKKKRVRELSNPSKRAFSIAEAMITLLIVSMALAAIAPIMSKKIKNDSRVVSSVPSGAVMFFRRERCPDGWKNIPQNWDSRYLEMKYQNGSKSGLETVGDAKVGQHKHFLGVGVVPGRNDDVAACYTYNDRNNPHLHCTGNPLDTMSFAGHNTISWPRVTRAGLTPNYALSSTAVNNEGQNVNPDSEENKPKNVQLLACEKE